MARVVSLKLSLTDYFFFNNLEVLIKLCKIRYLNQGKPPLFSRNQVFCLKNWKLWRAPTTIGFKFFCWNFAHVFYLVMETLRKRRRLEDVAVISRFFRSVHAQMRRFPCKQTSCWSQLLQNWCFQGILTFVEKYGKEKANNQHSYWILHMWLYLLWVQISYRTVATIVC